MNDPKLKVTATCVRVPVVIGHGESVYFKTTDTTLTVEQLKETLQTAPGVVLQDDPPTKNIHSH